MQGQHTLPRFSIIMVNYKTLELTKNALNFIKSAIDIERNPVWVVDNQSEDASSEYLRGLDWIRLIERAPEPNENGFTAHGRALDLAFHQIDTDYVFLFHTDTFLYDAFILEHMLKTLMANPKNVAVGCLEQVQRPILHTAWRYFIRFLKHYQRIIKLMLGFKTRPPRGFYEVYIKSFCALWDAKLMKSKQLQFMMDDRIPGYQLQDMLRAEGYQIATIAPRTIFKYLDHVEAGTVSLREGYGPSHKRIQRKLAVLNSLNQHNTQ